MKTFNRVYATVNLDAVAHNFKEMKENISEGTQIIAVIKTDGYGHGAIPIAHLVEEYDYIWGFATATIEEAVSLRKAGIEKPILILGFTFEDAYETVIKYEIRPAVFKLDMAKKLSEEAVRQNKTVHMHIKLDTGMGRIGFRDNQESIAVIKEIQALPNVELEGIFTHFAKADEFDKTAVNGQIKRYKNFIEASKAEGVAYKKHHCSNSAGIVEIKNANMDIVRAGITIYGLYPSEEVSKDSVKLQPVMELKSHIVYIKEIEPGEQISYGGTYEAKERRIIATIPVGYGDGYPRGLSNKGYVLICGKRAPICGRVCMDQFMVDITGIPEAREGTEVTLVGVQGDNRITVEELGNLSGRFNYEFVCDISKRVPRIYLKDGKIVETKDWFDE